MPRSVDKNEVKHEPTAILPRQEEVAFLKSVQEIVSVEQILERDKIRLAVCDDFNLIDAFGMLDLDGVGSITSE